MSGPDGTTAGNSATGGSQGWCIRGSGSAAGMSSKKLMPAIVTRRPPRRDGGAPTSAVGLDPPPGEGGGARRARAAVSKMSPLPARCMRTCSCTCICSVQSWTHVCPEVSGRCHSSRRVPAYLHGGPSARARSSGRGQSAGSGCRGQRAAAGGAYRAALRVIPSGRKTTMLVNDNLAALAAHGARTLAAAMTTGAWPAARNAMIRLFSVRGLHHQAAVRAQLDGGVALVQLAGHPDLARKGLVSLWELELALLLKEHPEAEAELRQFIAEFGPARPGESHRRCAG